jgi:hypothetical protein
VKSLLFWDVPQRGLVVTYGSFPIVYFHAKGAVVIEMAFSIFEGVTILELIWYYLEM